MGRPTGGAGSLAFHSARGMGGREGRAMLRHMLNGRVLPQPSTTMRLRCSPFQRKLVIPFERGSRETGAPCQHGCSQVGLVTYREVSVGSVG